MAPRFRAGFVSGCVWAAYICTGLVMAPTALATPSDDANFLNALYPYGHPQVGPETLIRLGHQACAVRRSGGATGDAKVSVSRTLWAQGVMSSNAEVGTLVHVAVDTLCPEVGYP